MSGADDAHEWTSYIPFDKLPTIYNPPSGVIAATAKRAHHAGQVSLFGYTRIGRPVAQFERILSLRWNPAGSLGDWADMPGATQRMMGTRKMICSQPSVLSSAHRLRIAAFWAGEAGCGTHAQLGWPNARAVGSAHHRRTLGAVN